MSGKKQKKARKFLHSKKAKMVAEMIATGRVQCARCSKPTWMRMFGNSTESAVRYNDSCVPDDINAFFSQTAAILDIDWVDENGVFTEAAEKIYFVCAPIDDEFVQWCSKNGHSLDSRYVSEYMNSLTAEDTQRLYEKNGWDVGYELLPLPVVLATQENMPPITEFKITDDIANEIQRWLCEKYGNDFVVFPYLLDASVILTQGDTLRDFGKTYFETGTKIRFATWDSQDYGEEGLNVFTLYIPVIHRYRRDTNIYNIAMEWTQEDPGYILDFFPEEPVEGFCGNQQIVDHLQAEFLPDVLTVLPGLIPVEFIELWENQINRMVEAQSA